MVETKLEFPVVGIGASAGGLEAIGKFLQNLRADLGMAFVIVTHQNPNLPSLLPELLRKHTTMPVIALSEPMPIRVNQVYVASPGTYLEIAGGAFVLPAFIAERGSRMSIDRFFISLAEDQGENAICIILSGNGSDGTLGMTAIKAAGGMAIVEDPTVSKYPGMPQSGIATGLADYIATPDQIPNYLHRLPTVGSTKRQGTSIEPVRISPNHLQEIFTLLRERTGNNFSEYKTNTLRRRIERRMDVHQIADSGWYLRFLQENPHEIELLFKELLISVTSFFRDADAWEGLSVQLAKSLKQCKEGSVFRAWVPGCATGQEVYSLAIILREQIALLNRQIEVQIFGTDLDARAIVAARSGLYPQSMLEDVSPERIDRFFVQREQGYQIGKTIREMAIFAEQNMISDPPFTKLDLISCRNLLIYLNTRQQHSLLPVFQYSLKPGGLLFLGQSETVGTESELFFAVDKRQKIYRREGEPRIDQSTDDVPFTATESNLRLNEPSHSDTCDSQITPIRSVSLIVERLLLARFAPPSVVINDIGDVIYIHGRTGMFLEPTPGKPRVNVLEMAREGLQIELRSAIRQALTNDREIFREGVRVKTNGDFSEINLRVCKLDKPESLRGLLLVSFELPVVLQKVQAQAADLASGQPEGGRTLVLERELQHIKDSHRSTLEELETSNEELKSMNEELQSTNEEFQSTNEELETSKEEMQSLNEELSSVNSELQSKMDALGQANDDMQNLLNSTDIATLFLDNDLNVNRFTEQTQTLIMLRASDVGRPVAEITSKFKYDDFLADCQKVLKTLEATECEICSIDNTWYLMRIGPYRTAENLIEGLVVTFVNIQRLKLAEKSAKSRYFFEGIVETAREPLLVLDCNSCVTLANRAFCQLFQLDQQAAIGSRLADLNAGAWNISELTELLEGILPRNKSFEGFELEASFGDLGWKKLILNARKLEWGQGLSDGMILLALEDITNK